MFEFEILVSYAVFYFILPNFMYVKANFTLHYS